MPSDSFLSFFTKDFSFEVQETCLANYNIDIREACHINFFPNDTVESYGAVRRTEFVGNADIAGIGVVVGFSPGMFLCLLGFLFGVREWARRSRFVSSRLPRLTSRRNGVTMLFDPANERSNFWRWLFNVLSNLLIANADAQLFIALAYGINFNLSSKCTLSAYHYKVGLNMVLLALASSNLSTLMIRNYWQRALVAASIRFLVVVVVFIFLSRMVAYQFTRTSRPEDLLYWKLHDPGRTDSSILLPMSCFLDPDLDPFRGLTDTQLARVGGDLGGTGPTSEIVLYAGVAVCFVLAHIAHLIRKVRGHRHPKEGRPSLWRWIVMGYWGFTLLTSAVAYAWCYANVWILRIWAHESGWINPPTNPETDVLGIGQILPIVVLCWVVVQSLDQPPDSSESTEKYIHVESVGIGNGFGTRGRP